MRAFINKTLSGLFQSTHLHEVRLRSQMRRAAIQDFNPRTCTRCDPRFVFQSAPCFSHFNPRTCTRCDQQGFEYKQSAPISIHAPARGAMIDNAAAVRSGVFQSTHLHEVRCEFHKAYFDDCLFQSTHLHEVRCNNFGNTPSCLHFNPRTCTRCDWMRKFVDAPLKHFNPRTCTRCDSSISPE